MKTILRIARLELSILFFSPIAWLVLVIFIIQSGVTYLDLVERFVKSQQLGNGMHGLTQAIYASDFRGFFTAVQGNLYLYMPLLTMGLMSRELSSGSIKLLFSSPVTVTQIIFGKYLAIVSYGFLFTVVLLLFGAVGYFAVENLDVTLVLSGIFGLYMLICAYSAIGLYMSCLTSYQVVAAIATLVVFAILNYIGGIGQHIDFVRDITYFLSIAGRTDEAIGGLISSNDVVYFIVVIALFLAFSILRLQAGRESKPLWLSVVRYTVVVVTGLTIGYITSLPRLVAHYDATVTKSRTLTAESQRVVKQMDKPVKITAYVNLVDQNATFLLPLYHISDTRNFEKYIRFLPDLKMEYVYYYDSLQGGTLYENNPSLTYKTMAEKVASVFKLNPARIIPPEIIRQQIDLAPEGHRVVRLVEYDGRKTFLRIYNDLMKQPSETEITAAMKRLVDGPGRIALLTGHGERSTDRLGDREYKVVTTEQTFRNALINQGFDVDTLSLKQGQTLPANLDVLIIADPRTPFSDTELRAISQYVAKGGNLFILGEPGRQALLNPVLSPLGVTLRDGQVVQQSVDFDPAFVVGNVADAGSEYPESLAGLHRRSAVVSMSGVAALQYTAGSPFSVTPLVTSAANVTWNTLTPPDPEASRTVFKPAPGEVKESLPLVAGLSRIVGNRTQRIVISGDADLLNNSEIFRRTPEVYNFMFAAGLFRWFTDGAYPVETKRQEPTDNTMFVEADTVPWLKTALIGVLPGLLVAAGSLLLLIRRKR